MDFMEEKNVGLLSKSSSISEASWGKEEILVEAKKQLKLAGPLVSVSLLTYSVQVISVMFVGHLGELPLAGASMATSFASVTGFSLLKGLCSALETFCGQSYGGKQYHLLGVHAQRAMLVLLLASVPLVIIWANTGPILVLLGQDPEISAEAGQYARLMIPGIFAFSIIQCATKFLQAQNDVVPMMVVAAITTGFHVAICWAFVFACGLGSRGAALANVTSYWINALLLVAYVKVSPNCKATWTGFSKDAFRGIPDFLKLSIPSAVMLTLEIWSFELMVLLSGFLPNPKLETSVMSISLNTCAAVYMIPTGLGSVISVRVSNELGAGRPKAARLAIWISMTTVLIETFLVATAMVLGRNVWGFSYSNERIVVKYVGQLLILIAILHVLDGIQAVLSGVVRGSGLQKIGAILIVAAYYVVGLPIAVTLAFGYQMGGKGLWMGIIAALLVQSLLLSILTIYIDWQKEVEKASGRLR